MNRLAIGALLALLSVSFGCIDEDRSKCDKGYRLELSYTGDGSTQIFEEKIENVMLYVFDESATCVTCRQADAAEVASRRIVLPKLPAGDYRVICLGNAYDTDISDYSVCDYCSIRFGAHSYFEGKPTSSNDSLYYASKTIKVVPGKTGSERVDFASSHYKVYVEVTGFDPDALTPAGVPTLDMHGVRPCTDFENQPCGNSVTYYPRTTPYDSSKRMISTRFNIMRHCRSTEVQLELHDAAGNPIARIRMSDFLAQHPEIDLSRHEVLIPVAFRYKDVGVEITLPEWYVKQITPEI